VKKVLWALDFPPSRQLRDMLAGALGDDVVLVGVGPLRKAEEVLEAMRDVGADEVVVAIDDPCEVSKMLDAGVEPLIALVEEVSAARDREECLPKGEGEVVIEEEEGCRVVRVSEFARITDVMFQLSEPKEKHEHEHES